MTGVWPWIAAVAAVAVGVVVGRVRASRRRAQSLQPGGTLWLEALYLAPNFVREEERRG